MKVIIIIILLVALLGFTTVYITNPKVPEPNQAYSYHDKDRCFTEISKAYEPKLLTYKGHMKKWVISKMDYLNIKINDDLLKHYKNYLSLEKSVNCYILATGDNSLNMGIGPSEFKSIYNSRAEFSKLPTIP